jgi:uncharacterized membrane protein YbhN (UPF0104 family)
MIGKLEAQAGNLADHLGSVDPRLLLVALVLHLANHVLRSLAWRNVLAAAYPERRVGLLGVTAAYATGVAFNAVAPARGGDAVKVALVRTQIPDSSLVTIAATMPVLMLFDLVAGTILVACVALFGGAPLAAQAPSAPAAFGWLAAHPPIAAAAVVAVAGLGWLLVRRARPALRSLWDRARQGGAVLRSPARYASGVALVQAAAWACRIGVVTCLLAAFGMPASPALAGLVMVVAGVSTAVPLTPGGAGTQQVLLAYVLTGVASAAAIISFSVTMQVGITLVNALLGVGGAMVTFRTARPWHAVRSGVRLARAER